LIDSFIPRYPLHASPSSSDNAASLLTVNSAVLGSIVLLLVQGEVCRSFSVAYLSFLAVVNSCRYTVQYLYIKVFNFLGVEDEGH